MRDRLTKAERALELSQLDARQADFDSKEAEAVSKLVASVNDIPQVCMRLGSIMLVKIQECGSPALYIRSLSQLEMKALDRYPEIQRDPRNALQLLANCDRNYGVDRR